MPIPHLSHKIHSPNNWKRDRVLEKKKKPGPSRKRGFFNFKKQVERLADIRLSPRRGGFNFNPFKFFKRYFKQIAALVLILVIGLIGLFAWLSKDLPDPNKLTEREVAQSTKIYDRTGEHLLYEIHGEQKRTIIRLEEVPDFAIQATLALEDQRFYEHRGFNLWGIFRGVVIRALTGKSLQGGSTLTQQLVKNAIVGDTRTVTRKLKELVLAYRIERKYSKDEILQMYFNEIPYGSTAYGIEAAATYYFAKSSKDLTLAEAAVLAALPQAPSYYSPWGSHIDELFGRQKYALDQMVKEGYITREQADVAKAEEITFANRIEGIEAPHFVFFVKELLAEKYGEKVIEQSGYKIISTLDYDLQKKAEAIITEQVKKNLTSYNAGNASLVAIDVKTGQILAMVGSKDFFDEDIDGQVNVAVAPRQPGSSFKPVVYATAFSRGFVPETVVYDLETVFPVFDGDYIPHDYDLKERGPVSLRTALAGSLNIPAVKMIYLAGIDNVLDLADSLEYSTFRDRSRFGLSLVLGGGEVKLLEHTNAYATFARDGKKMKYSSVLRLEDNLGKAMEEFNQPSTQKVLEPEIARMVTDILADNEARTFIFGASNYLTLGDRPVAAKTGTTNDYHDAWTLGYTPQLAVGVWVGNSDNAEMKRGADGSMVAAPI
ncbi:MAG TPA: transglycosylase domain-containing protein, partial [Patescibacteria group bacterium]|nr:transglycosylase domain-containing protein [Patescibacteria group bacterium]